jgi:hypothetical protein
MRENAIRLASTAVTAGLCFCGAAWIWDRARALECKAAEIVLVRDRIRPLFWGEPAKRYRCSFDAPHFVARYNYLTCMQNHAILFMREAGREGLTEVAPATDWIPSLKMTVDWDERNWRRNADAGNHSSLDGAIRLQAEMEETASLEKEELWAKTPFGYYARVDHNFANVAAFYNWEDLRDFQESSSSPTAAIFRAWTMSYPREVWKRLTHNPSAIRP